MDYFQPASESKPSGAGAVRDGSDGEKGIGAAPIDTAKIQQVEVDPFRFSMPAHLSSSSSSSSKQSATASPSKDQTPMNADEAGAARAGGLALTKEGKETTAAGPAKLPIKTQDSSSSPFFSSVKPNDPAPTASPNVSAPGSQARQPSGASPHSSTSPSTTPRSPSKAKEVTSRSGTTQAALPAASSQSPASSSTPAPVLPRSSSNWLGKSPRSTPLALSPSPSDVSKSASDLQLPSGMAIPSSNSSSSTSNKTVQDGQPQTQSNTSTSPKHSPTQSTFFPSSSSSSASASGQAQEAIKQRSCPIPSLRMPFSGGSSSSNSNKLPSGACASLPVRASSGAAAGSMKSGGGFLNRAFCGGAATAASRKGGVEMVQNPRFKAVGVGKELQAVLSPQDAAADANTANSKRREDTLVLDLRPHTAFVGQGRIRHSINICVPSTLLRRPAFALSKIAETISSRKDQAHFNHILLNEGDNSSSTATKVVVLDQETVLLSQESIIHSLMLKIEKSGYTGDIYWIRGGWNAIHKDVTSTEDSSLKDLVDLDFLNEDEEEEDDEEQEEATDIEEAERQRRSEGEVEEESESMDDLASNSEMSDVQDTKMTPRQAFPASLSSSLTAHGPSNSSASSSTIGSADGIGAGGAYFQNYLQGASSKGGSSGKGRSSQSSFTSTASSDSLFPSSIASSQSSTGSDNHLHSHHHHHQKKDRAHSTSPVVTSFDSSKLHLPHLRPSTSPSHSTTSSSSASSTSALSSSAVAATQGQKEGRASLLSSSSNGILLNSSSSSSNNGSSGSNSNKTRSTSAGGGSIIRPKNLPMAAFQYNSTAQAGGTGYNSNDQKTILSGRGHFQMALDGANMRRLSGSHSSFTPGGGISSAGMEKGRSLPGNQFNQPFGKRTAANPFFDNIRQNIESQSLDHVLQHVAPLEIPSEFVQPALVEHLPDFLKNLISMTPKARAEKLHKEYFDIEQAEQKRLQRVLDWHCQQSVVVDYKVAEKEKEKAEEKRRKMLKAQEMKVDGESHEDGKDDDDATYHPFSISAGVEKGHLNRYKNMWPYEHARVRLESVMSPTCGDYINASHIQLRGTSKRYIASQGPLEQTTEHFWRLVLQENVHVIVMLTLLQEGGREKCSNYFQTATYGDIQVTLKEEKGSEEAMKKSVCKDFGFFSIDEEVPKVDTPAKDDPASAARGDRNSKEPFYASTPLQASDSVDMKRYSVQTPSGKSQMQGHKRSLSRRLDSAIVRRTIEIRKKSDPPETPPKTVRHIQYIKWPDFDIPPDPNVVIDLISETNKAQRDLHDIDGEESPVLVHCSAGVGRTGTFIAVDTLLERYRRERRAAKASASPGNGPPRARVRRSGSDIGSSLHMQELTLAEGKHSTPDSPSMSASDKKNSNEHPHRPAVLRSTSSQESPRHLQARLGIKDLLPEDHTDPIHSLVNQMREQRMSSVANAGQYIFTYLALLAGISQELAEEGVTSASPVA